MLAICPITNYGTAFRTFFLFRPHGAATRETNQYMGNCQCRRENQCNIRKCKKSTRTDKNGKWSISLPPMQAGGPYTLSVKSPKQALSFTDILVGEVWICSGQSNMEFRLRSANHAIEEVAAANYPQIRSFNVIQEMGHTPKADLKGKWEVCSPVSASDFQLSAISLCVNYIRNSIFLSDSLILRGVVRTLRPG